MTDQHFYVKTTFVLIGDMIRWVSKCGVLNMVRIFLENYHNRIKR